MTLATGDRVLVKNQSSAAENGIWVVGTSPARATDADAAGELKGGYTVKVTEGDANADTEWTITTNGSITPGTTAHAWEGSGGLLSNLLPWTVDIDPAPTPSTVTGWSTFYLNTSSIRNGYIGSSGTQNDEIGWDVVLGAGTWTLGVIVTTSGNSGIITASLDGSSVGTMDCYSAGVVFNVRKTITGIAVATSGKKRLLLKMATKNASSAGYFGLLVTVCLRRTA